MGNTDVISTLAFAASRISANT